MSAIDVSDEVSGEGPPLYMVHGIGSRKVTWDGILDVLERSGPVRVARRDACGRLHRIGDRPAARAVTTYWSESWPRSPRLRLRS